MGFWNELLKVYDTPSKLAAKGVFKIAKGVTGSDKVAGMGARMNSVSTRALGGDPIPFRENQEGYEFGMSDTSWRKARQAGDWLGSAIGAILIGGAAAGGGAAAAGEGGGAEAGGGLTSGSSMFGETIGPAGEGGGGAAAGGFNWQNLLRQTSGKMGNGYQQGAGLSLSSIIAQQQAEEAARQAQEMLGGDTDLINYMARMQMQNNLRRIG
jgi:hypothetical protein